MKATQKLHQSNLSLWVSRFKEQKESGLSIKSWCLENNISIYAFNYWKYLAKEEYVDSILPDIVPIGSSDSFLPVADSNVSLQSPYSESPDSRNSYSVRISFDNTYIEIGPETSDYMFFSIIKAVRHT